MFFLSLFMDLMMLLNLGAAQQGGQTDLAQLGGPPEHTTHGHLPGPTVDHFVGLADHSHHGQHGHTVAPNNGGDHFH